MKPISLFAPALLLFLTGLCSAHAEEPKSPTNCTGFQICLAHSVIMKNAMEPQAKTLVQKTVALLSDCAKAEHPFAAYALGYAYESGNGVPRDSDRALDLYLQSAYGGSTAPMAFLVDFYNGAIPSRAKLDLPECYAWAAVAGLLGDERTAARASLCHGTAADQEEGKKRAEVLLKKVKAGTNASKVGKCG